MAEIVMPDGEGGDGRGDGRADADTVADTIAARESAAHRRMPTWQPSVTPERWLHSDTVEDVRARQARQGLPTPRALPPELTDPRLATASGAKQPAPSRRGATCSPRCSPSSWGCWWGQSPRSSCSPPPLQLRAAEFAPSHG